MSYRISKKSSVPLNASIQDDDEYLDDEVDNNTTWAEQILLTLATTPSDWHLVLNEWIQTIDWDAKARPHAQTLGHCLTLLFYVIRLLQDNVIRPEGYKMASKQDAFDLSRSEKLKEYEFLNRYSLDSNSNSAGSFYANFLAVISKIFNVTVVILLIVNLGLAYQYLCGHFRTYSLFNLKERPASKHLTKRNLNNLNDQYLENVYNGSLWSIIKYLLHGSSKHDENTRDTETYYSLRKWIPSKFTTYFFASFSPTCIFFLLICGVSFTTAFPVVLHQIILHCVIVDRFEERLADEMVIHQALVNEYESKVVKPLTLRKMQDVQVDATPYGESYVRFLPAVTSSRSHTFKTHSVVGDTILERFNSKIQEFEDVPEVGESHNVIVQAPQTYKTCPHRNVMPCQHFDSRSLFRQPCDNSNSSRRGTPPGFYSPCVSTISGISSQFNGEERSPPYLGPRHLHQTNVTSTGQRPKRKSTSPLRRPITKNEEP